MLEIRNITLSYRGLPALDNVSLNIRRNETISVIGQIGSGKSSLLHCIAGLTEEYSGTILLNGKDRKKFKEDNIGMVFQNKNLFPHMDILGNLTVAPVNVLGTDIREAEAEALEMLDAVGMSERKHSYPDELSLGQRQRVAIARSLMMHPEVLLLDEPTASLDPISASEVADVIRKIKESDITVLIVTHNIDFAAEVSDRIFFMYQGRICESGTPSQILENPSRQETRAFIEYSRSLVYDIWSEHYDHPGLNARIEHFCNRYRLGKNIVHSIQLVVEEILNILPLDNGLHLVISKSPDNVHLIIEVHLPSADRDYLDERQLGDNLSYTIIKGMSDSISEGIDDDGKKILRFEVRNDIL